MADPVSRTGVKWIWLVLMALLGAVLVMYVIVGFEDDPETLTPDEGVAAEQGVSGLEDPDAAIEPLYEEVPGQAE